jgi:dTDP-4-amino-4,6-dideoxygalactose transaminase
VTEQAKLGVPFLDLGAIHAPLSAAVLADMAELIATGAFTDGPQVGEFEQAFATYCGTARCVGTASGLDALRLSLIASGLAPGDEVVVPALTFVATVEAVTQAGGAPVVADVSEADLNLDPDAAAAALTRNTRFVLPVHLYGQLADMSRIGSLGLEVVEDACQAHGAERDGFRAGTCGRAAAFSFYPGKNLGAMGDAGALTTDDDELADTVHALRQHGQRRKYEHDSEGYTARLDTIQALVLLHKLQLLDGWNLERRRAAALYLEAFDGVGDLLLPPVAQGSTPVWHLFVIRTADPAALGSFLSERGIQSGRHYPIPVHLTSAYAHLGYEAGSFPVAESVARSCLSLPIFPGISESAVARVVEALKEYFSHG